MFMQQICTSLSTWNTEYCITGIRTETRQKVNGVHCSRGIYLCLFECKALFVCVKDRTYLRMAITAFSIFGSIFGALFCLLFKKLILECDTIWKSMSKFLQAVWSMSTFPRMDKEETFFSWKLHIDMIWIFYIYLFIRPENFLKI